MIEEEEVTNILASVLICFLMNIQREMPVHAKKARLIHKAEEAIRGLAHKLTTEEVERGVKLYNSLLREFEEILKNENTEIVGELQDTGRSRVSG